MLRTIDYSLTYKICQSCKSKTDVRLYEIDDVADLGLAKHRSPVHVCDICIALQPWKHSYLIMSTMIYCTHLILKEINKISK